MKKFTQRRNPISATNEAKHSVQLIVLKLMIEFTLWRSHMYVSSVAYLSVKMVPLLMKELRLGRTTMDTNNVAKNSVCRGAENFIYISIFGCLSALVVAFVYIKEFTLYKNSIYMMNE